MLFWLTQLLPYFVFAIYQFSTRSPGPPAPLPPVLRPPGVPFGLIHFTDYPLKPKYKDYTPEKKLELNPLARIQSEVRYNRQGLWIFSIPKLFRGKFNYLPAYNLLMGLPVNPKPTPASSPNLPTNHTGKLFGIVYITLKGVIDTIILTTGPWSWVGKSVSYLFKLAPLLWWALPSKNLAQVTPENNRPPAQDWIPDTMNGSHFLFWFLVPFLSVVLALENPTLSTDRHNSSSDDLHQKESLVNGWFKYPSGQWGRKFHYGCTNTPPPPAEPSLIRPNMSFYLLTYLVGYYLLGRFISMMGRFAYLGHFGHLAMVTVPIGLVIAWLNLGALAHNIGDLFPLKWVPETPKGTTI
ncbi:hypothetical protein DSO57_1010922 [Entomophthora muscae]|uniref:Uncharacterized protein n=1 Tax=Entomophthora muscae TaxID=34485 RepID=A0ACC2U4N7_9FUNG|nr:hypothetical protein DSO57_1010922 [Entomophthora muscae]